MHDPEPANGRVTTLLAASATAVYLLVVVGATTALLDGAAACATWPACHGEWVPALSEPALVAAWLHRVATVAVGGLLAVTGALAHYHGVDRRARLALGTAVALYPAQVGIGALTALTGAPVSIATVHLVVGVAIFSGTVLALLWHLEGGSATDRQSSRPPHTAGDADPVPDPSTDAPAAPVATRSTDAPAASVATRSTDASGAATATRSLTPRERVRAYVRLTKPKLWWLLCLVAVATMVMAEGWSLDPAVATATVVGGVLAIGASGTFNNVFERDVDRRMDRTDDRPLVTGEIPVSRAVAFAFALLAGSVAVFVAFVNVLAAGLALLAVLFYSVVYTLVLKPNTSQNIVVGGAVGAFPALIGWAAVENAVGVPAVVLGAVVFLWTPAHFYNLALAYRADYDRAGIPMLPVVRGAATTRRHVLLYLGATMVSVVALGAVTGLGWVYAATVTVAGGVFLWAVVRLSRERTEAAAFRAFHASNAYLGSLLVAIVVDTLVA